MPQLPNEYTEVEQPLIAQLEGLGWQHLPGDVDVPYLTEREGFRQVLLLGRLREAIRRINVDDAGQPWLDGPRLNQAVGALERLGSIKLMEANQLATDLLLRGTVVEGDPNRHGGREQTVRFIDLERPERNDYLVVNQFRVDPPGMVGDTGFIVPDLVLFVNGIPLVVIECKSPAATNPMEEGITQLLRYSNQRDWVEEDEGVERLFHYNQFLVSTFFHEARVGTIGASYEHYVEWKDTSPVPMAQVAAELGVQKLSSQQLLVAGMLRPEHLLDIVRHFTLFQQIPGRTIKIVARYMQFRAVHEAIRRLQHGQTRTQHGESDQRGGIIWHTQGSGKSLAMVFLVRKMRSLPDLRRFKVVVVTDRTDLETQLSGTAALTGETVHKVVSTRKLKQVLAEPGPDLVFAMIQKYQETDLTGKVTSLPAGWRGDAGQRRVAGGRGTYTVGGKVLRLPAQPETFPVLNESADILVLVDEAHRSHASALHANLLHALPNCARIGFTGTPIIMGERKQTQQIFGDFIDRYTLLQSQADGTTIPILYEGRTAQGAVANGRTLDDLFEDMCQERTPQEMEALKRKYATRGNVLEAPRLIEAKATDMLCHYINTVLPNGFKAQVVATSRRAAIRYRQALCQARDHLVSTLARLDPALLALSAEELERRDPQTQFLVRAHRHLEDIRRLEFATVISGSHNQDPAWNEWSDKTKVDARIERFKKPLQHKDPAKCDGLAFLCVKSMLLTGFDAPCEQVLYLDRFMQGHELLQAIARVNRVSAGKTRGLVVDYYGVGRHLHEALAAYNPDDVQGALFSLRDELPKLEARHRRVLAVFQDRGIADTGDVNACVELLRDEKLRAEFIVKLKQFLESVDIVLPRPEALPYLHDARILGFVNKAAANLYRDSELNLVGLGRKVRQLIDEHIIANGIDPKVPPISILDAGFEEAVDAHTSNRAKASEMEYAARHDIAAHYGEDPAYYKKLSQRLEEILREFQDNWEELVKALRQFTREYRRGRPADESGLDPRTQVPFLGLLVEEASVEGPISRDRLQTLAGLTVEMVEHIRQEIRMVDFWRNTYYQNVLRGWIARYLDEHDVVPFRRQQAVADRVVELAKNLHLRLTS